MTHESIHSSVGALQPNLARDVRLVQTFLNRYALATKKKLAVDGVYGPQLQLAIMVFQRTVLGMTLPDGIVRVGGLTIERLRQSSLAMFCSPPPWLSVSCKIGLPSESDYDASYK